MKQPQPWTPLQRALVWGAIGVAALLEVFVLYILGSVAWQLWGAL